MARIKITQTGSLTGSQSGTNDTLNVNIIGRFYGDALVITDNAAGGNDKITGLADFNQMTGDAETLSGNGRGGNDRLAGLGSVNNFYGDAIDILGNAKGGNDVLIGRDSATNDLAGDAIGIAGSGKGGNDVLIGGGDGAANSLQGDATRMSGGTTGGNDTLIGGNNANNTLIGDARNLSGDVRCGDDELVAGNGAVVNNLYGDGFFNFDNLAYGGDDRLISGTGNDFMFGDWTTPATARNGNDVFVFAPDSGQDRIGDFRSFSFGEASFDKIDVRAYGITSLAQLGIVASGVDTVVEFGGGNQVTLLGFDMGDNAFLSAGDFIFA